MRLFKYFSAERLDVLRRNLIRFTPPPELNDPFEMVPHISLSETDYEKMCDEDLHKEFALGPLLYPSQPPISFADWKRRIPASERLERKDFKKEFFVEFLNVFPRHMQIALGEKCGLLCLSENHESLLMWAHYAIRHTGFVLEFDPEKEPFCRKRLDVKYQSGRPVWKNGDEADTLLLLSTKSLDWEYEKEHRLIRHYGELEAHPLSGDSAAGQIGHFAALPEDTIKAVYLGCRMAFGKMGELLEILKRPSYQHVQIFVALPLPDRFTLQFLPPDQISAVSPEIQTVLTRIFGKDYSSVRRS